MGKNAMALKEMESNEKPLTGAGQVNMKFLYDTCLLL